MTQTNVDTGAAGQRTAPGPSDPDAFDGDAALMALYEEKLRAGARAAAALRERVGALEAQLAAEREERAREVAALTERAAALARALDDATAARGGPDAHGAADAIAALQARVAELELDRRALERAAVEQAASAARAHERARALVHAIVERTLAMP